MVPLKNTHGVALKTSMLKGQDKSNGKGVSSAKIWFIDSGTRPSNF